MTNKSKFLRKKIKRKNVVKSQNLKAQKLSTTACARKVRFGHQESLFSGLQWHLDVPINYVGQFKGTGTNQKIVFPGKADTSGNSPSRANVNIKTHLQGSPPIWKTDVERSIGQQPKMYGFDFGIIGDVFYRSELGTLRKRLICQKTPYERVKFVRPPVNLFGPPPSSHEGWLTSVENMMRDLMLSAWHEGGEVCLSYHMVNPSLPQTGNVSGKKSAKH